MSRVIQSSLALGALLLGLALGALLPRRPPPPQPPRPCAMPELTELDHRVDLLTYQAAGIEDIYLDRIRRTGNPTGSTHEER